MPIFVSHNFTDNFLNAIGASDNFMLSEMIIDEVGKLIVENKREVVDLLRKHNIGVSIRDNNVKISQMLSRYISSDPKIRYEITDLIKSKSVNMDRVQSFIGEVNYLQATGKTDPKVNQRNKRKLGKKSNSFQSEKNDQFLKNVKENISEKNTLESISNAIADTLEKTFSPERMGTAASPLEYNSMLLEERVKMNEIDVKNTLPKWAKITIYTTIATIIIGGAIFLVRYFVKKDMPMDPVLGPNPPVPPINPVPPTNP